MTPVPFPYLDAYNGMTNYDQNCDSAKSAIFVMQPVYKNGETVSIYVYFYSLSDKKPLSYCQSFDSIAVSIFDGSDKEIGKAEQSENNSQYDSSMKFYQFKINDQMQGGSYYAQIEGEQKERDSSISLLGDWNVNVIRKGDVIKGKINIKTNQRKFIEYKKVSYEYQFTDKNEKQLKKIENQTATEDIIEINYLVPDSFSESLRFTLKVNLDGEEEIYFKEFREVTYEEVIIEFVKGNRFLVVDKPNPIYFSAFKDKTKKEIIQIQNGKLLKKCGNDGSELGTITDQWKGMGKFSLHFSREDVSKKCKYFTKIIFDKFFQKEYLILDLENEIFSNVFLKIDDDKVFESGLNSFSLQSNNFEGEILLVIRQYDSIKYQKIINVKINDEESDGKIQVNLDIGNAGVYTLQIYQKMEKNKFDSLVKDQNKWGNIFEGELIQEIDFFLKPKKILKPIVEMGSSFSAGDSLDFKIILDDSCDKCIGGNDFGMLLVVLDANVFQQVNQENLSPSIITKIFLEKEIFRENKDFPFWQEYIEGFFKDKNEGNQKVDLLLGNQIKRHLLFTTGDDNLQSRLNKELNDNERQFLSYFQRGMAIMYNNFMPMADMAMPVFKKREKKMRAAPMNMMAKPPNENQERVVGGNVPIEEINEGETQLDGNQVDEQENQNENENQKENKNLNEQPEEFDSLLSHSLIYTKYFNLLSDIKNGTIQIPNKNSSTLIMVGFAFDRSGNYGWLNKSILSKAPISVFVEKPLFFFEDSTFIMQIKVENNTEEKQKIIFESPQHYVLEIASSGTQIFKMQFKKQQVPFVISSTDSLNGKFKEKISPSILFNGIRKSFSSSGYLNEENKSLKIKEILPDALINNSPGVNLCYTNSIVNMILKVLEQFNQIPCGCFEQASSANFPLVIALKILLMQKDSNQEIINQMKKNLEKGIKLLLGYETTEGGFEWFGKSPGHSTLTAYGLWQFAEIADLKLDLFEESLFNRLKKFFEKMKNEKGGFIIRNGLDSFGNPDQDTSDLYVSLMLIRKFSDFKDIFIQQKEKVLNFYQEILNGSNSDTYKMALVGLFLWELGMKEQAEGIMKRLLDMQNEEGMIKSSGKSITNSTGSYLEIETTALALLLIMKQNKYAVQLEKGVGYLAKNLKSGWFGSTQGTILSLLVFEQYFKMIGSSTNNSFTIELNINDEMKKEFTFDKKTREKMQCFSLSYPATNEIKNQFFEIDAVLKSQNQGSVLISLEYQFHDKSITGKGDLEFSVNRSVSKYNIHYDIKLENRKNSKRDMSVIELYLPTCIQVDLNSLEDLKRNGSIDYYEIREQGSQIAFYLRGLNSMERREFGIGFARQFKFQDCEQRVHRAFLYYEDKSDVYSIDEQ